MVFLPFVLAAATVLCLAIFRAAPSFSGGDAAKTIVLDAGHGAPDGGAVGPSGTQEKDVNLDIVLKLREILESRGVKVILTREGDSGIYDAAAETIHEKKVSDMHNRLKIINGSGADLFISIHMNAFTRKSSHGLHVFYSRNHPEAEPVARAITGAVAELTGAEAREVKAASDTLYLMKDPKPPAILVECGFITNPDEERLLLTDEYRARIAYAIADAIAR